MPDDEATLEALLKALWGDDPELTRRMIAYGEACNWFKLPGTPIQETVGQINKTYEAVREHIAAHYVRRDRINGVFSVQEPGKGGCDAESV